MDLMLCRAIAIRTGIPLKALTEGRLSPREYELIESELPSFRPLPVRISEERDIKRFANLVEREVTKSSDTVVFVDYIGLLRLGRMAASVGQHFIEIPQKRPKTKKRFLQKLRNLIVVQLQQDERNYNGNYADAMGPQSEWLRQYINDHGENVDHG